MTRMIAIAYITSTRVSLDSTFLGQYGFSVKDILTIGVNKYFEKRQT